MDGWKCTGKGEAVGGVIICLRPTLCVSVSVSVSASFSVSFSVSVSVSVSLSHCLTVFYVLCLVSCVCCVVRCVLLNVSNVCVCCVSITLVFFCFTRISLFAACVCTHVFVGMHVQKDLGGGS